MFKNTGTPVQLHDLMHLEPGYKPGMTWGMAWVTILSIARGPCQNRPGNPDSLRDWSTPKNTPAAKWF